MLLSRCSQCPGPPFHQIYAETPTDPDTKRPFLFLGAGPAKYEQRGLRPYLGPAGEECTNTYLSTAGFRREDIAIGNCCLCWDGQNKPPSENRAVACARHHLPYLLNEVRPEVLVLMGGVTQKICDTRIRLDMHRGRPIWTSILNGLWTGWVWPTFEPALGMRDTPRMTQLLQDFQHLGEWVEGKWSPPTPDPNVLHDYKLVTSPTEFEYGASSGVWHPKIPWVAVDTEKHGREPWSVQWSQRKGQARMALATDTDSIALLQALLPTVEVFLHECQGDLNTLEKLGIFLPRWRDTMQEAFHLCYLPQGLKPLTYRSLGVTMTSWEDTVWPASIDAVSAWMGEAIVYAGEMMQAVETERMVMGVCEEKGCGRRGKGEVCKHCGGRVNKLRVTYAPRAAESVLRHCLTYTQKNPDADKPYNPWKKLVEMKAEGLRGKRPEPWEWEVLEEAVGPAPILGIGNCDIKQAVDYACGDSDHTGQIAVELAERRKDKEWVVEDADVDDYVRT